MWLVRDSNFSSHTYTCMPTWAKTRINKHTAASAFAFGLFGVQVNTVRQAQVSAHPDFDFKLEV
jgi:hypothetical protein